MKKILFILILTILAVFAVSAQSVSAYSADYEPYKLSFATIMENDQDLVKALIDSGIKWSPIQRAVLDINLILLSDKLSTLNSAVDNLDKAAEVDSMLYKVYRGMSEAFLARKRTVFGVKNLQNAEMYFTSIPEDYDDWYIRLLRGMSFYGLGMGLPGVGPMKEPKELALTMGENDLNYVLKQHQNNSVASFSPENYDWSGLPVPDDAADFAAAALD